RGCPARCPPRRARLRSRASDRMPAGGTRGDRSLLGATAAGDTALTQPDRLGRMPEFRSAAEFREVMDKVFTIMSTDPEMGPKLRDARVPQRFEFPDQDAVVNIT